MDELPDWPVGTVAILSTGGGAPHGIPVSTALRAGPRTVLLALALRRESLARLRTDPRCALTILDGRDLAFTAHAHAEIVQEPMAASTASPRCGSTCWPSRTTASRASRSRPA